jgi:hypothetical protein
MAVVAREAYGGSKVTDGVNPSAEVPWIVTGASEEFEARNQVRSDSDSLYDLYGDSSLFLPRASVTCTGEEQTGDSMVHYVTVRYAVSNAAGESVNEFDIGGTSERRFNAITELAYGRPDGGGGYETPPSANKLIGNTKDGVEGVDVVVPTHRRSVRVWRSGIGMTSSYQTVLASLVGTVNDATFRTFPAYSVLLEGVQGAQRASGDWELLFRFSYSPNATGLVVGNAGDAQNRYVPNIDKGGHEYLWVLSEKAVLSNVLEFFPKAVYVDQVYDLADFGLLELPADPIV